MDFWHFVIQTDARGIPLFDFGYTLLQAIDYAAWVDGTPRYGYTLASTWPSPLEAADDRIVPIGSLEWVEAWWHRLHGSPFPEPLYIPDVLRQPPYLHRAVWRVAGPLPRQPVPVFIKSATRYKGFAPQITDRTDQLPAGDYWLADVVDFRTEWRAFVYRGRLVGLHYYSGDFTVMPDVARIQAMIADYTDAPAAYTLDVGVLDSGDTALVEVHPLVSCGFYGFSDLVVVPGMLIAGWLSIHRDNAHVTGQRSQIHW